MNLKKKIIHSTSIYLSIYYLLGQRLATCGLEAKSGPMPAFVNKMLQEHSRAHLFMNGLELLLGYKQ